MCVLRKENTSREDYIQQYRTEDTCDNTEEIHRKYLKLGK